MGFFSESEVWNSSARKLFGAILLISQFDGLFSSKMLKENSRHVPWNNKNSEFEGERQNMMGF